MQIIKQSKSNKIKRNKQKLSILIFMNESDD